METHQSSVLDWRPRVRGVLSFGAISLETQDSLSAAAVTRSAAMATDAFIQCRVSQATKAALRAAAQRQQLTESALVKRMIEVMLQTAGASQPDIASQVARHARLYVRLTADDWALLRERANARCLAPATYASMLLRAHLRTLAPLPKNELSALQRSINELGGIGRNLNQIARVANAGGRVVGPSPDHLASMLRVCEGLRDHVRALIKANLASWEAGHAQVPR